MVKNIKMGKVSLPMEVNSASSVPAFENMIKKGPMAVVMVYADWCGHCDNYKKNVWSSLKSVKNRTVNMATVREDMLPKTSLKDAKIDGYPSILVVGKDKKPAVFNSTSGPTNALPESNNVSTMKSLVTSTIPDEISNQSNDSENSINSTDSINSMNSMNSTDSINSMNSTDSINTMNLNNSMNSTEENSGPYKMSNSNSKTLKSTLSKKANNNYTALNNSSNNFQSNLTPRTLNTNPPSINDDEINEESVTETPRTVPASNQGTTPILRGGRLFRKFSMKHKKSNKKQTKRKTRKH